MFNHHQVTNTNAYFLEKNAAVSEQETQFKALYKRNQVILLANPVGIHLTVEISIMDGKLLSSEHIS